MTRTSRPRSLLATHRLAACLLAAFWCAAPVLAAMHANAEVHRYCVEHARVEESGQLRTQTPAERAPAAHPDSDPMPGHDGCAFARICRFGQVLAVVVVDPGGILEPVDFAAPAPLEPAPPVPLLSVAPKTSPPVA
jgi:hypothetical protein